MNRNTKNLPFFSPSIGKAEFRAVKRVMRSGWLTTGPEAAAFEREFAAVINSAVSRSSPPVQALAVNSATSGLHLSLEAAGIKAGDRVAVPSLTFTATAEIIQYLNARPVFIDSEKDTGNMSAESLAAARRECLKNGHEIKAVIPVHLAGRPCNMKALRAAMEGSPAVFIEDAAHAFPSRTSEGMAGSLGDAGVFSFYATKTITTGEGGMVISRNSEWMNRMRTMRLHGIDREVWNRYRSAEKARSWEYDVTAPGFKYNMTDMAAAVGRVQLRRSEKFLSARKALAAEYSRLLDNTPGLSIPRDETGHAWHLYIVRFRKPAQREQAAEALRQAGIGCSVHFIPLHRMTYWKNSCSLNPRHFPEAEYLADRILSLPLWPGMPVGGVRRTAGIIRSVL